MKDGAWNQAVAETRRRWLVTGAAGFVGSHLVSELLRQEQDVVGLDNFSTGHAQNLHQVRLEVGEAQWKGFRLLEADIRDTHACDAATEGVGFVLHQAALGSVPRSVAQPLETHAVNGSGTLNVFISALGASVNKVVFASSSSVYGDSGELPKTEGRIGQPLSPYAVTKRMGELYAEALSRTHGLPAVGLRYFNVIGRRQDADGPYAAVLPRWCAEMRAGRNPVIYGDGETSRDFCPVSNVVQANIKAALSDGSTNGNVYNVALGGRTTLNELFVALRRALVDEGLDCAELTPVFEDFRPGDIRHSVADISKAASDLQYVPEASVEGAVKSVAAG